MISLKQSLGIIALLTVVMACIAITIRPPSETTNLASGLLFAFTVTLFVVALARVIATLPGIDRFWMGFLAAGLLCFALSCSSRFLSANTAPTQITSFLLGLRPLDGNVAPHLINARFYAMQAIVTNAGVLTLAILGGLLAQQSRGGKTSDTSSS